jgi:hypothetical protein
MLIRCLLGRIAPVVDAPGSTLEGAQNSSRWIFDLEHEGEPTSLDVGLVDWRTGKPLRKGLLQPALPVPLNRDAARALIYFSTCRDGRFRVCVEPSPDSGLLMFRLAVDVVHSLMR